MTELLATSIYNSLLQAFGSDALVLAFALIFLTIVFFITRQSLSSSVVLGILAMNGLALVSSQDFILYIFYAMEVLIGLGIGWVVWRTIRRVS